MKLGEIVYQDKTSKGENILIRYPQEDDMQAMCDYINTLSKEQTFIRFQGEQISLEDETKYLNGQLEKIRNQRTVQLLVICGNQIVGIAGVDLKEKTESHEGVFDISLAKEFRGEGLGKTLMRLTLEEAENNLPQLRLITLGVFGDNTLAQELYKKFGFQEYGRLPGGSRHKDQYVDHIYMYKKTK